MRGGWFCALGALVLLHCKADDGSGVNSSVGMPGGGAGLGAQPGMQLGTGGQAMTPATGGGSGGGAAGNPMLMTMSGGAGGTPAMTGGTGGTRVEPMPMMDAGMPNMTDLDAGHDAGSNTNAGDGETGRLIGITAAHNAVRALVDTQPDLPPLKWSTEIAAFAQDWADMLAVSCDPQHRDGATLRSKDYGENLAASFSGGFGAPMTDAKWAVDGWAAEVDCWTYGTINDPLRGGGTEKCDMSCYSALSSDGCGHYTQIVWRESTELGCGFSTCMNGGTTVEIWICNYAPAGNYVGEAPY